MKKINVKIGVLKSRCLTLRINHQIPSYLSYLITHIDDTSSKEYVAQLMALSEHYLRVKGYYKKYPQVEEETNALIKKQLKILD